MMLEQGITPRRSGKSPPEGYASIAGSVALTAEPGQDPDWLARQYRSFVARHLTPPDGVMGSGRTAWHTFARPTSVAQKVLSILTELGLADNRILETAAHALYRDTVRPLRPGEIPALPPLAARAISVALAGMAEGQQWAFRLGMFRGDESGRRQVYAQVHEVDPRKGPPGWPDLAADMRLVCVTIIPLTPIYTRLAEALR